MFTVSLLNNHIMKQNRSRQIKWIRTDQDRPGQFETDQDKPGQMKAHQKTDKDRSRQIKTDQDRPGQIKSMMQKKTKEKIACRVGHHGDQGAC